MTAKVDGVPIAARQILVVDDEPDIRAMLGEFLSQLGYAVSVVETGRQALDLCARDDAHFDAALVDVPCSNTGVLARRVEVRHRLKPVHLQTLRGRQSELLERAAGWLKSGGRLVYSTCSVESAENEQMVGGFLERHSDFERVRHCHWLPGRRGARGKAPVLPGDGFEGEGATGAGSPLWRDGGYACLLERRAGAETVGGAAHACARGN